MLERGNVTLFRHGRVSVRFNESCLPRASARFFPMAARYLLEFARCERIGRTHRPIGLSLQKLNMATLRRCRCPMICGRSQKGQRRKNPKAAGWYPREHVNDVAFQFLLVSQSSLMYLMFLFYFYSLLFFLFSLSGGSDLISLYGIMVVFIPWLLDCGFLCIYGKYKRAKMQSIALVTMFNNLEQFSIHLLKFVKIRICTSIYSLVTTWLLRNFHEFESRSDNFRKFCKFWKPVSVQKFIVQCSPQYFKWYTKYRLFFSKNEFNDLSCKVNRAKS